MNAARRGGFTLVEVLVALFVVALGMGALMATLTSAADTTAMLRERSLAQWVALNRVTDTRLKATAPSKGKSEGDVDYAGSRWRWQQEVSDPGLAGILRIDVTVAHSGGKDEAPIATATGFYGSALAAPNGMTPDWTSASPPATGGTGSGTAIPPTPAAESAR